MGAVIPLLAVSFLRAAGPRQRALESGIAGSPGPEVVQTAVVVGDPRRK